MARDLGTVDLALASELGLPLIGGIDTEVLQFPAFNSDEAIRIIPDQNTDGPIRSWVVGLDLYLPQPTGTFISLLQTGDGDGDLFLRDNGDGTAGIGIGGVYDGNIAFDTWTRIVVSVTQTDGDTILNKFVDGMLVGTQNLGVTTRYDIDPAEGLRFFTDNDGETSVGAIASLILSSDVPTTPELEALLSTIPTPDAGGFFPEAPSSGAIEVNFDNSDVAPRYGAAAVIVEGFGFRTPVSLNESAFGFASQFGVLLPGDLDAPVLDYDAYGPDEGVQLGLGPVAGDLESYTAIWDINVDETGGFQALLQTDVTQSGDGELFINAAGGIGINGDYDGTINPGDWHRIAITVEAQGDGTSLLSKYIDGAFLDTQTVSTDRFTLQADTGFLLLSDNDGETSTGYLSHFGLSRTVLDAAEIAALGGVDADGPLTEVVQPAQPLPVTGETRNLTLQFDSSFRPYDDQTGEVFVSIDGGAFTSLLLLDTDNVLGGTSSLERVNETVELEFQVSADATDVAFAFNMRDAGNDWWWAIDNLSLRDDAGNIIFAENFDGLSSTLQDAVDENIGVKGWTQTGPDGWAIENAPEMPQGTTEWQGWSFATPEFWTSADGQSRDEFSIGTGVIAIADPDEWDDFNTGSVTGSDFDSTLTTPTIALEQPATPQTAQIGFDDYDIQSEFGIQVAEVIDNAPEQLRQDNINDLLLKDDGTALEIDLAAAFADDVTDFTVTSSDGTVVTTDIAGSTLTLSGASLGHSDIVVSGLNADGETVQENFRAIVAGENAYVFAVIPDTQDYTSNSSIAPTFGNMTDWLVEQKDTLAIEHVIHVGDIVQFGSVSQWEIAEDALERLDGELSYTLAIGNHDQQRPGFSSAFSFETDVDTYFTPEQVGATAAQGGGTYDGFDVGPDTFGNGDSYASSIRNSYTTFETRDGTDWLVFSLEFGMPDDVLRWASEVIEDHLDHRVIIDTHAWNGGDGRITPTTEALNTDNDGWGYAIRENPRSVNGGEDAWRELASNYPNITFTFNGHNFMGGAETVISYGAGGNPTFQTFVNYQNGAWFGPEGIGTNGGNGAIRLVVVDPDNDRLSTHTKLVELDTYFEEFPDHQEVFENVDLGTPEQIAIAKAGETMVVAGDGISGSVTLDPSATLGDTTGASFVWYTADGEKLGETDGTPLEVALGTGTNRLILEVTDADGNVSTDEKTVLVEAPGAYLTETFDDGDAEGWGAPSAPADTGVALGTDLGFSLPSLGGVAQVPMTLSFDSSFRPYADQTGEVLVSFDDGATFSSLLTLDTESLGGNSVLDRANVTETIDFAAPASAENIQFAWRMFDADNDWWWAIDNVSLTSSAMVRESLLTEDFEGLALMPFESASESGGDGSDWTNVAPDGWVRDLTDTPLDGPVEFQGWTFLDKNSWIDTAGNQARDTFERGTGTVAVADGDEYDDLGNIDPDLFNVFLETPEIDLTGYDTSSIALTFDSSFRPYTSQNGTVEVSFDGGASYTNLLTLNETTITGGNSSLERANEEITLNINAGDADAMQIRWGYTDAGNDWWWAIDNVDISAEPLSEVVLLEEDFEGLPLQNTVDEVDPGVPVWTPTPPSGWEQATADTMSQGATEFQGWTFMDKEFWIDTAGDQSRSTFTLGTGNVAVADPDEWDDANEGAAGDTNEFDSTLTTPLVDITGIGGGTSDGAATGVLRVPAFGAQEGLLVKPLDAAGQIDSYTLIYDLYLPADTGPWTSLFQTDLTNAGDGELFLRNDGDTLSVGISGDYDGAIPLGAWSRLAFVFDTDEAGVQTLSKYLDGELLDSQVVDGDVSDGSRWSFDAADGFLLFADDNNETNELYTSAFTFTTETLDATQIAALGAIDADGPLDASSDPAAFQLNFDGAIDATDFGAATVESFSTGGLEGSSYVVKGSIFGNPNGEGEAALYQQSNGADEVLVWQGLGAESWNTYVFDMVVEPADNDGIGAVFYYQDADNHYRLDINQQDDTRTLVKIDGGVETVLATESGSYRHYAMQDLRIAVIDDTITITLDDELLFGAPVVDTDPLPGGTVGIVSQDMDRALFDNITVNPVVLAARALTVESDGRWVADTDGDGTGTVHLSAAASLSANGIAQIEWLVGDAVVATGETAALDLMPGETPVTLRVTDTSGAVAEDQITVDVASADAVYVDDTFDDGNADGWRFVEEGTIDGPADWQVVDGALVEASDLSSTQQNTGSTAFSVAGDGPYILRDGTYALWDAPAALDWTDYSLSATITPNDDDGIGLMVRYQDADNYYKLESDADTGLIMLTRHLEGRETILARGYQDYTPGVAQEWRIEVEDGHIRTFIDGKAVFGTPVEDRTLESGTVGLYSWGSTDLAFDNVMVTALGLEPAGPNQIVGTDASDTLEGTDGADQIRSQGGSYDLMSGGADADQFIFGTETQNGIRERDVITDFEADLDMIVLEGGTSVLQIRETPSQVLIQLDGDRDVIYVRGEDLTAENIIIVTDDMFML